MANIFTVAASHAPYEQLLRRTDFAEKSNYKVIRGNHSEVTFLVLIIKINWKKKNALLKLSANEVDTQIDKFMEPYSDQGLKEIEGSI